ncbi:MAG TPA: hypothetical protein VND45_16090 [Thermoanaerobaculia bacterium]|nr:hypothetical protein [Thermoanaerobaculia bacterium]
MSAAIRILVILMLTLATASRIGAQATPVATETTETTTTTTTDADDPTTSPRSDAAKRGTATDSAEAGDAVTATAPKAVSDIGEEGYHLERVRNDFQRVLREYTPEMVAVIVYEPSLLTNEEFLRGHPTLSKFVAAHPEVAQHPAPYLQGLDPATARPRSTLANIMENVMIFGIFVFIAAVLAWLVRTIIEQKRWSRLSRQQAEVHSRILERFGTTQELMEYIRTPAGAKFLESAPISLHTDGKAPSPHGRVLLSVQIGVVVAAAALGMLLVSLRFDRDTAADLFALGTIGFCIGAGFIGSALISLFLSKRLGGMPAAPDDAEPVK